MLTQFTVQSFKNFDTPVSIQLLPDASYTYNADCLHNQIISKAILTGPAGSGKTNLGQAIMDLHRLLFHPETPFYPLSAFTYQFQFGKETVQYSYALDFDGTITSESLIINDQTIYTIEKTTIDSNAPRYTASFNEAYYKTQGISAEQLHQLNNDPSQHTQPFFVSTAVYSPQDSLEHQLIQWIQGMSMTSCLNPSTASIPATAAIPSKEIRTLHRFCEFLQKIEYSTPVDLQVLCGKKCQLIIDGKRKLPFFPCASSSLLSLAELFFLCEQSSARFIYLDDFDASLDNDHARAVVQYLKNEYPDIQFLITTHRTHLFTNRIMRPDCLFLINPTFDNIQSLHQSTRRSLNAGHNLERMLNAGEFSVRSSC